MEKFAPKSCFINRAHAMIAIYGGTFDPIHLGHLHVAHTLQSRLKFDRLIFMPAAQSALKSSPVVSATQRAQMIALAIENYPDYQLDTREYARKGTSYTVDTLKSLREDFSKSTSLSWIMGSDAFLTIRQWHDWQSILGLAHLIVVSRPETSMMFDKDLADLVTSHRTESSRELEETPFGKILFQEINALNISSTKIREHLKNGQSVHEDLPPAVLDYIITNHLYGQS
jgi:nicotinate-nucleotide adenylyltransferase